MNENNVSAVEMDFETPMLPDVRSGASDVQLLQSDAAALEYARLHSVEASTLRVYLSQWRNWQRFCEMRGYDAYPAAVDKVAAWLIHRATSDGVKYGTVQLCLSAVVWVHRAGDLEFNRKRRVIRDTLRALRNIPEVYVEAAQAKPLDLDALAAIRATACSPRIGRGGKVETGSMARQRGPFGHRSHVHCL